MKKKTNWQQVIGCLGMAAILVLSQPAAVWSAGNDSAAAGKGQTREAASAETEAETTAALQEAETTAAGQEAESTEAEREAETTEAEREAETTEENQTTADDETEVRDTEAADTQASEEETGEELPTAIEPEDVVDLPALAYDDYCSLTDTWPGYEVDSVIFQAAESWQVSGGEVVYERDQTVVEVLADRTRIRATGVGTAELYLKKSGSSARKDLIRVRVTVKPADLALFFLVGQSNMEGHCGGDTKEPFNSPACREGTVYSTFAAYRDANARSCTGIRNYFAATIENKNDILPGSLTSTRSVSGAGLVYPTNALTTAGLGKTGPDAALAWKWNQLTGEKVYVVNAAIGGATMNMWVPGAEFYDRAVAYFTGAQKIVKAEVAAGHYKLKSTAMFWLQGEYNSGTAASEYRTALLNMYNGFARSLGISNLTFGMIAVRACNDSYVDSTDLYMTGPRVCQYSLAADPAQKNIWMVSNANEAWVSDSGVCTYFAAAYPGGKFPYPLRSAATLKKVPTTVDEVHPDIHYTQAGHNENGITAAEGMYHVLKKKSASAPQVFWRNTGGSKVSSMVVKSKAVNTAVIEVSPLWASKSVTLTTTNQNAAVMNLSDMGIISAANGTAVLSATVGGNVVGSVKVQATANGTTAAPALSSVAIVEKGIQVKWKAAIGCSKYRVYRKVEGGSWGTAIGTTTGTTFTDTKTSALTGGKKYFYTVRGVNDEGTAGSYNTTGLSILWIPTPVLKSAAAGNGFLTVKWDAVPGAVKYRVYRRTSDSDKWVGQADVTTNSWQDNKAVFGQSYTYTVRAYGADGKLGYYDTAGVTGILYEAPVITAKLEGNTARLSWNKVSGCKMYRAFVKGSTGGWQTAETTSETSCVVTGLKSGEPYSFSVRCMTPDAVSYTSGYNIIGEYMFMDAPVITYLRAFAAYIEVKWGAVNGAEKYIVYRKAAGDTKWTNLGTTTGPVFQDTKAVDGVRYTYTVKAQNVTRKLYSPYLPGNSITRYKTPQGLKVSAKETGVLLKWTAVTGAEKIRIFYRIDKGSWKKLADVSGKTTEYLAEGLTSGANYSFTLRCLSSEGYYTSDYDRSGQSIVWLTPVSFLLIPAADGITVKILSPVTGAEGYRIYRKTEGGSYKGLITTKAMEYKDTAAQSGVRYYYTVRAVKGTVLSWYDTAGKGPTQLSAP